MARKPNETQVEKLALAVARGLNVRQAAKAAGLPETTARRYASDPAFKPRVDELRGQMIGRAVGKLAGIAAKAARKIGELIDSDDENVALRAARAVLSDLIDVQSHADHAARLETIERQLREQSECANEALSN